MKKLILMLTILVSGMVQAQTFDFTCEPQFEGWTHTPTDIRILSNGNDITYNTTVIGGEFNFNYEGPGPVENEIHLYTGVSLSDWGTNISNGDYFLVKSSNTNFAIIQGKQITQQAGRIIVDRTVYRNNNIFSWETHSGVLTIGKIADPVDNDFTHVPGVLQVGDFDFNTATSSEERFEFNRNWEEGYIPQIGDWSPREFDSDNLYIHVSPSDAANYPHGGYVVMKQQDVTDVNDVFILKIDQPIPNVPGDGNGGFVNRIRMYSVHTPTSWSREDNKPIQLGVIVRN